MFIYCLFCDRLKSEFLIRYFTDQYGCRVIYPIRIQHLRKKAENAKTAAERGKEETLDVERPLLPGYLFLYFEEPRDDAFRFRYVPGVIKCLSDTSGKYELQGGDADFAMMIYEKNGIIGKTQVYQEGDRIRICEGAFKDVKAEILKVDRRTRRMQVAIPFARQIVRTWLEYDIVKPENPQPENLLAGQEE